MSSAEEGAVPLQELRWETALCMEMQHFNAKHCQYLDSFALTRQQDCSTNLLQCYFLRKERVRVWEWRREMLGKHMGAKG